MKCGLLQPYGPSVLLALTGAARLSGSLTRSKRRPTFHFRFPAPYDNDWDRQ
jgi:hypothetical protein